MRDTNYQWALGHLNQEVSQTLGAMQCACQVKETPTISGPSKSGSQSDAWCNVLGDTNYQQCACQVKETPTITGPSKSGSQSDRRLVQCACQVKETPVKETPTITGPSVGHLNQEVSQTLGAMVQIRKSVRHSDLVQCACQVKETPTITGPSKSGSQSDAWCNAHSQLKRHQLSVGHLNQEVSQTLGAMRMPS